MNRKVRETIPDRLIEAGRAAGRKAPLFGVGMGACKQAGVKLSPSAHEVILQGRQDAGITDDPILPELGPHLPDPYED